jgi:hypothetical protein
MQRITMSAFTRVFNTFAAWCAADPGPSLVDIMGPGSAEQR